MQEEEIKIIKDRERKGAFYTPPIWVELSQKYLADTLGENWQDEYYIWDCAAGTGNLLAGLTNKFHVWASTLDRQDVDVMRDRIKNGANMLETHVFQFDFLNDDFSKLPQDLQNIINDTEKRKKLVIYINPPYAEAANYGRSKDGVSSTKVYSQFKNTISFAVNELFSQFFARIYHELPDTKLASFSTLKYITASNFSEFRKYFKAECKNGFVCRATTFDNVKGNFPISFLIWDLENKTEITKVECDVLSNEGRVEEIKTFFSVNKGSVINDWLRLFYNKTDIIAHLRFVGPDFQANKGVFFTNAPNESDIKESRVTTISKNNVVVMCIYLAVRQVIEATWLNDRDQFLYPNNKWEKDTEFQHDCLAYALLHGQNKISANGGTNHWIPFTEIAIDACDKFESNFMAHFIAGKIKTDNATVLFGKEKDIKTPAVPLLFSLEAQAVLEAGKVLWTYYHAVVKSLSLPQIPKTTINASLYDIKAYFQGRNAGGRMNPKSEDKKYMEIIKVLRESLKTLALKMEPKVYEYGFLKV